MEGYFKYEPINAKLAIESCKYLSCPMEKINWPSFLNFKTNGNTYKLITKNTSKGLHARLKKRLGSGSFFSGLNNALQNNHSKKTPAKGTKKFSMLK